MKIEEVDLIDRLIHAEITRLLLAQIVAHCSELEGETILSIMLPIEAEIETLKDRLTKT
jgi:hypothetical protein